MPTDRAPTPISACVITFEEADRIEACLESLAWCDQVLVVDSGSRDGTVEKARAAGAEVIVNAPFPGHREQKQFAVDRARHDWVLCLDADECLSPELVRRLRELRAAGLDAAAYSMPRRNRYLGKVLRAGLFWPDRKVRLFDRRRARWGGVNPHDRVEVDGDANVVALAEPIEHDSYRTFGEHVATVDRFTEIAAAELHARGRRATVLDLLVRPWAVLVKHLVVKRGFLDGWRGLLIGAMAFYYDWLKYLRLLRAGRRRVR